jgi:membrane protein YqaA with SNARE-associated domain
VSFCRFSTDFDTGTHLNVDEFNKFCGGRVLAMSMLIQSAKKAAGDVGRRAAAGRVHAGSQGHLLRWLVSLGGLGLFGVAIVDSSVIPLPLPGSTDLLLLLLTAHRGATLKSAILLATCALAGSILGGYLTWSAGRKGGGVALERYVPKNLLGKVTGWVERHGAWSIGLAAILPPPVPLTPFLLAAGALHVPRARFLVFYGSARAIRYGLLAWLGLTYGRHILRLWQSELSGWSERILWIYGGLVVLGIGYGVWKFRKARQAGDTARRPAEELA